MFCVNCGTQLPEEAKFCFKCGADMGQFSTGGRKENSDSVSRLKDIQDNQRKSTITLRIGKWKLEYPESIRIYIESHSFFVDLALSESQKFSKYYNNAGICCLEDVLDKGFSIFATQVQAILDIAFNRLLKYGIDTFTPIMYFEIILKYYDPTEVFQPYQKAADAILKFANEVADRRDAERMMRGKWVGGGFGIKGAIKGAIKASALNTGTNMLRGIGDTITNASDRAKLNKIRAAAFPEDTPKRLSEGMFHVVMAMYDAEISLLTQYGLVDKITFDSSKEKIQYNNRFHSISMQNLDSIYQAAIATLQADPFDLDNYKLAYGMVSLAGGLNKENRKMAHDLFTCAEFFGVMKFCKDIFIESDIGTLKKVLDQLALQPETMEQKFGAFTEALQLLKEQNPYLDAEQALKQGKEYRDNIVSAYKQATQMVEQDRNFRSHYAELMSMIRNGNISEIWSLAKKQDSIAQYVLIQYYKNEVLQDAINQNDSYEFNAVIRSIREANDPNEPFTQCLTNDLIITMYLRDRRDMDRVRTATNAIGRLSDENNCVSADAYIGYMLIGNGNKRDEEDGGKKLKAAAEKLHPLAMAWYASCLMEGTHGVECNKTMAKYYLGMAVYAGQGYALKLNKQYHLELEAYHPELESQKKDTDRCIYGEERYFIKTSNQTILTQIPKSLVVKYRDRFKTAPKDIIMTDGTELTTSNNLIYARKAFKIPPQEMIYFVVAANLFGHFKENMSGIAVGASGIYTRGGPFSLRGLMPWDKFGKVKIYVENGLYIGDICIITTLDKMLEAFFKDLHKIYEADINPNIVRKIAKDEDTNQQYLIESPQVDTNSLENVAPQQKEVRQIKNETVSLGLDGIVCPSCNKMNKPGKRFCTQCGSSLSSDQFCKQCGAKLKPGKKFCSGCGTKIE